MIIIVTKIKFFISNVLSSMFLAYLIPIINVIIIYLLEGDSGISTIWKMNGINILIATNACYIASISDYLKINERFNSKIGYIKTVGLVISTVSFAISTYELQKGIHNIPISVYYFSVIISLFLCILLAIFNKIEDKDINSRLEKSEIEKAMELINRSKEKNSIVMFGQDFEV